MDAKFQVSSDEIDANQGQRNNIQSEESNSLFQIVSKQKNQKGRGKDKQEKSILKKVILKKDVVNGIKQQISEKNIKQNNKKMNKKNKQNNISNKFDGVFNKKDEVLLNNEKIDQEIIQNNFKSNIQEQNQFNQIDIPNDNSIQQPQEIQQQINLNQIQQNQLPNYLNNAGQFQYLRMALLREDKDYPILFKRFLNYLQMTQEEYDNIKKSFPEIPSEYLPQVILEQRQINQVFQNKQPQQQQQQQSNQNNQYYCNQQNIQQQYNFIETEFQFNPNLSEGNLECAICAQTYQNGEKLAILPCIHRFHQICFTSWLKKSTQCPICYHG